ncbi:hypothetical protein QA640_22390 [Bradyrhizobium sp. CB82]|uniref:hypothetical protein n=1 Tax=Bradyrhizobium sp. CB82 TaxID=3039159 RepID=UPI0024B15006|nr:hypothetical protein [Bradyrhizobium sp. CB82]WFU37251.1 hypothetical protein QA640_22390 [Bradyrhizobium sp. CB82]
MPEFSSTRSPVLDVRARNLLSTEQGIRRHVIGALRSRRTSLKGALQPLIDEQARMLALEHGLDTPTIDKILQSQCTVLNVLSDRYDALDDRTASFALT